MINLPFLYFAALRSDSPGGPVQLWHILPEKEAFGSLGALTKSNNNDTIQRNFQPFNSVQRQEHDTMCSNNGVVQVSTGSLKMEKLSVVGHHIKSSNLKLNAEDNLALAA